MSKLKKILFGKLLDDKKREKNPELLNIRTSIRLKSLIIVITVLLNTIFFAYHSFRKPGEDYPYSVLPGYIWSSQTVVADFTFPVYKSEFQYLQEVNAAKKSVIDVFIYNEQAVSDAINKLKILTNGLAELSNESNHVLSDLLSKRTIKNFSELSLQTKQRDENIIRNELTKFLKYVFQRGLSNVLKESVEGSEINIRILPNEEKYVKKINIFDTLTFFDYARKTLSNKLSLPSDEIASAIIRQITIADLIYSRELTDKARDLAAFSIPRTIGIVRKGEKIVDKGEKVNKDHIRKLQSYESSFVARSDKPYSYLNIIGSFGHALILYFILIMYLFFIRKKVFYDNVQVGILSGIITLISFQSWLSIQIPSSYPIEYLVLLPAFSMLVAIVFDSRTAFYLTITAALMLAGIRGNDYETCVSMMLAGMLASYTVRDIQRRTQMYQSIFFIFIGFLIPEITFGLERSTEIDISESRIVISLLNAAISPIVTFGLLFILEKFTSITTDLKIKEFDNLNHPLLVKLNELAPGTYQHTLSVAALAERCAIAIEANPLLTKIGAYYHDIGKMIKPEYFTENGIGGPSKHDSLSSKKSASLIREHVQNGIELAKQYKLPARIIDFIPMHHGTFLIKHFYAKALEEQGFGVNIEDFRYPGPKPNSKETTLLMICDASEALSHITGSREELEEKVDKIFNERFLDGQFESSNLTVKEMKIIKEICIKNLTSTSHQRVVYKEIPDKYNEK
ncbi:MAG: HDIG domain-containing protein [Candidatus Kapabacteria bacterium]|nr:HDIG domain-containing protein [Candidatus Kapabacteria bacterium]